MQPAAGRDRHLGLRAGLPRLHPPAARRRRDDSRWSCGDGIDSPTTFALGEVVEGVVFTSSGFAAPGSPMAAYQKKYQAKYGKAPESIMDALGYDLAKIIEAAVTKADSVEPAKVREALANLENVQGATAVDQLQGRQRHADPAGQRASASKAASACWSAARRPTPRSCPTPKLDMNAAQYAWRHAVAQRTWMCATAPSRPCAASTWR